MKDSWKPPPQGFIKANFDRAIRSGYSVAATVLSDENGQMLAACSSKIKSINFTEGEAFVALLATRLG